MKGCEPVTPCFRMISEAREATHFPNLNGTSALTQIKLDRSRLKSVPANLCQFCPSLKSM